MTWQEELRKLDEDFSAGRITADQYRERRDQVLSSAVTQQPTQDQTANPQQDQGNSGGQSNAEATQVFSSDAVQQPQPHQPPGQPQQPPAQQPQQPGQPPQPGAPDPNQWAQGTGYEAEQTQAVPSWQVQQPPVSPPGGFPQQAPASPPGGFPQQPPQQPAWHSAEADASPPWGGDEFPPIAPATDQSWLQQEDWNDTDSKRGSNKVVVSAIVILLIAGLTVGAWWLLFRGEGESANVATSNSTAETTTQPPPTTTTTTSTLPAPPPAKPEPGSNGKALIKPPGKERLGGGAFDLKQARKNKLLPSSMLDELKSAKLDGGLLRTTTVGDSTTALFAVEVKREKLIEDVADAYAKVQEAGGLPLNESLSMQGVRVYSAPDSSKEPVFRAVYVLHSRVIIVETFGKDRADVQRQFWNLLQDQVDHAPPTVREP